MSDIFQEVDEDLRREEYARLWKHYGAYIIGFCLFIVLIVAGRVGWSNYQTHIRQAASLKYQSIVKAGQETDSSQAPAALSADDAAALSKIQGDLTPGYRTLAKLELAAAAVGVKKYSEAIALYDAIAADKSVAPSLRDIATLKSAYLQAESLSLTNMRARIEALAAPESAFRFSANELLGYVAYRNGDYKAARDYFQAILSDPSAPGSLLKRSQDMANLVAGHLGDEAKAPPTNPAPKPAESLEVRMSGTTWLGIRISTCALALVSLVALEGCSILKVMSLNKPAKKVEVQGKRISVLTFDKPLEVSDGMQAVDVEVPRAYLNEDWPQTGGYSSHTMYNLRGPSKLKRLWKVKVGEGGDIGSRVVMSPIVAEGKVFAMDTEVSVAAFDAKSGSGLWRTALAVSAEKPEVGFGGGLAYDNGKVFAATGFGDVFALNPKDGAIVWRQKLDEPFRTAPTVFGGRVYVTSFDNQLFVLDSNDGHVLWNYRAISEGAHILSETSPAVAGDSIVAPFSSGELVAFLADNGPDPCHMAGSA